jgi:zeta-carotene desaturase
VTELKDAARVKDLRAPAGIDNLLYSADTYFSCFADLALTSPVEYFKEGQGSLMQCVITPAAPYMPWTNEAIAAETDKQVSSFICLSFCLILGWFTVLTVAALEIVGLLDCV